jgi:hypothetical protein
VGGRCLSFGSDTPVTADNIIAAAHAMIHQHGRVPWTYAIASCATHSLRCAALLRYSPSALRALPLVLLDGSDTGGIRCCCTLFFAPAAIDGRWYGTIARCVCALAWRIRMAAGWLAGRGALRTSAALTASIGACSECCPPGGVSVLTHVVGHEHATACECMMQGCAVLGLWLRYCY